MYVHKSVLLGMVVLPLQMVILLAQHEGADLKRQLRTSGRRALILMTLFLPVVLTHWWPTPTYPGSRWTMGQAVVGFIATLCLPGFVIGLITGNWLLAWTCVYWWVGAFLLAREYRSRGFDV